MQNTDYRIFLYAKIMTHIANPKFHVLDINGQNYQSWRFDVELHLQGECLANSLKEDGNANAKDKANVLIFMPPSFA